MARSVLLLCLLMAVASSTEGLRCSELQSLRLDFNQYEGLWLVQEIMPFLEELPEQERSNMAQMIENRNLSALICSVGNYTAESASKAHVVVTSSITAPQGVIRNTAEGHITVQEDGRQRDDVNLPGKTTPPGANTVVLAADPSKYLVVNECKKPVSSTAEEEQPELRVVQKLMVLTRRVLSAEEMTATWNLAATALNSDLSGRGVVKMGHDCLESSA